MSLSRDMKQGDLEPDFDPVFTDDDGYPLPLDTATSVKVTATQAGVSLFTSRSATGDANGQVNMPWVSGDTDDVGEILLEVEVEWTSGRIQTFPDNGYFIVNVTPDLT